LTTLLLIRDIQSKRLATHLQGPTLGRRRAQSEWLDRFGVAAEQVTIVSEILDSATKKLFAQTAEVSDYVMSNELISMYLAMVAENRAMNAVLQELLSAEGQEIYVRHICFYLRPDEAISEAYSFWDLTARARLRGEIAIGYISSGQVNGFDNGAHGGDASPGSSPSSPGVAASSFENSIVINPPGKDVARAWDGIEALIVLAEQE